MEELHGRPIAALAFESLDYIDQVRALLNAIEQAIDNPLVHVGMREIRTALVRTSARLHEIDRQTRPAK